MNSSSSREWASSRVMGGLLLAAAITWTAGPAFATPLGLQTGDIVDTIEWDALATNGHGGVYSFATGTMLTTGQVTSADVQRAPAFPPTLTTIAQSGISFTFATDLVSYSQFGTNANSVWVGSASVTPDLTVTQGVNVILTGNFTGNFVMGGSVLSPALLAAGNITITGGDANLIAALGGVGGTALLELTASVFNFTPGLATLAADGNMVNSDFSVAFSGTLRPNAPAAFVPEPGAVLMFGLGATGIIGLGRRYRRQS